MRIHPSVSCLLILAGAANLSPAGTPPNERTAGSTAPSAAVLLRKASELARKQGEQEQFWISTDLLRIGDLQIRAGDFEGALRSIRASGYPYGRDMGLVDLAEALALAGKKDRAIEVAKESGVDMAKLEVDMNEASVKTAIGDNLRLGDTLGVSGTPSYVLAGELVSGAVGYDALKAKIDAVRKCGATLC